MSDFGPLFQLSLNDLYEKLKHDLERMKSNPTSAFPAFDFFVTAYHMLEWHPGYRKSVVRNEVVAAYPELAVCEHIATGAKHYCVRDPEKKSVERTYIGSFSFEFSEEFDTVPLRIRLKGDAERALGSHIEALDLATLLMRFWRDELTSYASDLAEL
ncbi:MAG: hypothetical protein WD273_10150 [Trueperaceae bacterium]